ncbi:hypothetical protein As57867_006060, partial [Aphanomyces stellatus]
MDVSDICNLQATSRVCHNHLEAVAQFATSLTQTFSLDTFSATRAIKDMRVGIMRFATNQDGSDWTLLQQALHDDTSWSFYGWAYLYDWVQGTHEVVSFEGDAGTLVLISTAQSPILYATNSTVSAATRLIYFLMAYTSHVLGFVALSCLGGILWHGFQMDGTNLFWFNRIMGCIWLGRPLLLVRGITALLILSTTQLALVEPTPSQTRFACVSRSWLGSMVLAGEATWVLYVGHDFLAIAADRRTKLYGPLSCLVAWIALVVTDVVWPVQPAAFLSRQCTAQDMNQSVQCSSGVLGIGHFGRCCVLLMLMGIASVVAMWTDVCAVLPSLP